MAIGISGSNGGIGEVYRKFVIADVNDGIIKYEVLSRQIDKKYVQIFRDTIRELKGLLKKLEENEG